MMTMTDTRPTRIALLLQWREHGFNCPRYGLIDEEQLLLEGETRFLASDGRSCQVSRHDILLLEHVPADRVVATSQLHARAFFEHPAAA
jgi:hypothetical protein